MNPNTDTIDAKADEGSQGKVMSNVISIDEGKIWDHLDRMVVGAVEETLNAFLDAEADQLRCQFN